MLTIFNKNGQMRTAIEPSDNSTQTKEVQGENLLNISFTHYEHIPLDVLDYVDFEGERYWLLEKYAPKQINSQEWSYDLKMYGADSLIKRFLVLETTDGNAEPIFTLTATPREHAQMVLNCINAGMGNSTPWQLGQVDGENLIVIDYNGTYCNEALTQIVEAVGGKTEWWFDAQTLNICRCESGDEITLAYGNGLTELERDTSNIAKFYTRLFPIGSDRNIDPEKYGYFRLMLPEKRKYVEIQTEEYGVFDHFEREAFADIYPRRIGTISEVRSEDVSDENGTPFTIYYFKDDTLDFDPNQYELPNETKRISFQDGDLAGMGETDDHYFECNYNSDTREFELITIWPYDSDMQLPGGNIIPRAGDHYILWNITMPDEYYTLAEQELQQAVEQYNAEHWFDLSVYKGTTDHVWMEMEGKNLFLGRRVRLENQKYFPETGFRNSRITKITRKVNLPLQMDIEISDAVHAGTLEQLNGSLSQIEEEVESNSKKAEQYRKEAQDFTVRRFRDTQETIRLLEKAMLANFTSSVSPLSVHTMAALVGDESLQFRFIDNNGNTVLCDIAYSNTTHQLTAPKSVLQHLTLGIDTITSDRQSEEYKTWNLEAYTSPAIISETDTDKAFYLYAKVSKTENTGTYLLTDKAVAMEEAVGSYHLLIGILNSEYNGERSFVTLYGFTEILPGRITTDKIVSGDGKTYFDLANSEIGGNIKFKSTSGEYKGIEEGIAESIDGIETGTRNLILDSLCDKKIPSLATTGGYTTGGLSNMTVEISDEVLYNGKPTLKIQNKPTYYSNQLYIQFDRYNRTDTKLDVADYVFSCMMYVPETYPDRFPFENRVGLFCYNGSTESGNDSYVHADYDPSKKGTWQKLVAKVPYVKPADGATDWCLFRIRSTNSTTQGTGDPSLCCLYIAEIQLVKGNKAGTWTPAPEDAQAELQAAIAAEEEARNAALAGVATEMAGLQEQIDGQIESWFEGYNPTTANEPASTWIENDTEDAHMNDTFTNLETGASWRWGINTQTGTYAWIPIADTATQKALQEAAKAQSTAEGKSTTYLSKPTSYSVGDLWILESDIVHTGGKKGDVLTANATRSSYIASDWSKQVRYTDDTLAETAKGLAESAQTAADAAQSEIDAMNDDGIFDKTEKQAIRTEWECISGNANTTTTTGGTNGSYYKAYKMAESVGLTYEDLTSKFTALRTYLNGLALYTNSNTGGFSRTTLATNFAKYYNAETALIAEVQKKIVDDVQIGGTNICTGSSTLTIGTGSWAKGNWRNSISNGTMENIDIEAPPMQGIKGGIRFTTTGQIGVCQDKDDGLNDGAIVTMSCWVRSNNACTVVLQPYYNSNNSTNVNKSFSVPGNNIWTYLTWSNPRKYAGSGYAGIAYVYIMTANCIVDVCGIKLEKGNKPTAWSPAPEDTDAAIADAKKAGEDAQAAINTLNDDNVFSIVEKKTIRVEWESISGRADTTHPADTAGDGTFMKTVNTAAAIMIITGSEDIVKKYDALKTQLNTYKLYTNSDTTLAANFKTIMAGKFADYYDAEVKLMQAVQEKYADNVAESAVNGLGGENLIGAANPLAFGRATNNFDFRILVGRISDTNKAVNSDYLQNNAEYVFSVGKVEQNAAGMSTTQFTVCLYNFAASTSSGSTKLNISSSRQTCTFTVPATGNWSLLIYNGVSGATSGNQLTFYELMLQNGTKATAYQRYTKALAEAMQGTTDIDGGLVLTNLIQLKNAAGAVTAGITGLDSQGQNVFLWCGGTFQNALAESVLALIRRDGSGFFAGGKMKWGTDGSFQVGIFQVYQDRIVVSGDNGESITITNLPISDVQSNAQTVNIGTGLSGTKRTGTFNNTSSMYQNTTLATVTGSSAGKGNYMLKGSVRVVLNLKGGSFTGTGSGIKPASVKMNITVKLSVIIGGTTLFTKTICNHTRGQEWGTTKSYTYDTSLDGESFVYSGSSSAVTLKAVITKFYCGVLNSSGNSASITLSTTANISMVSTTKETIIAKDGLVVRTDSEHYFSADISENTIKVIMKGLPTSKPTTSGQLWNSGGTLKIS